MMAVTGMSSKSSCPKGPARGKGDLTSVQRTAVGSLGEGGFCNVYATRLCMELLCLDCLEDYELGVVISSHLTSSLKSSITK